MVSRETLNSLLPFSAPFHPFLHHTGKRTEVLLPSKHNAIGSQGFEATGNRIPLAMLKERNDDRDERAELARAMREEGKTLQQIADELGYKSVSSVHSLLNKD